jgi:hypothetical protein
MTSQHPATPIDKNALVFACAVQVAAMSDADLRLFTDATVAMLDAIKQEWDRRPLDRSPAAGKA